MTRERSGRWQAREWNNRFQEQKNRWLVQRQDNRIPWLTCTRTTSVWLSCQRGKKHTTSANCLKTRNRFKAREKLPATSFWLVRVQMRQVSVYLFVSCLFFQRFNQHPQRASVHGLLSSVRRAWQPVNSRWTPTALCTAQGSARKRRQTGLTSFLSRLWNKEP